MSVTFMADEESPLALQPADRAFDLPPMTITAKGSSILSRRFLSAVSMRCDKFNASLFQCITQPVCIGRFVIEKIAWPILCHTEIHESFNRVDFSILRRCCKRGDGDSLGLGHQHELCALAFLGLTHLKTPFFAGEKVPSPIACFQFSSFRRSRILISRSQALTRSPASVQSRCRRQQVAGDGYRSGKSCHRAPFFRTQRIPSRHSRAGIGGRPPAGEGAPSSNKSLMRFHWESLTNGFGAVLDPVVFGRRRFGHMDRVINMRATPFALTGMQLACH